MVPDSDNPSMQEGKAGGMLKAQGYQELHLSLIQPRLQGEALSQKGKT